MKTPSNIRTPKRPSFSRFGLHAVAFFVALAGMAAAAPIDPSELVAPKIEIGEGVVKITIEPSVAGRIYQLQVSDDLTAPSWQNLEKEVKGDGNNLTITTAHIPGDPRRFFRVVLSDGLVLIPAGAFTMGRTSGDTDSNAPPVTVNVSAFYMGKYEVTKAEWDEVQAWAVKNEYADLPAGAGKGPEHPVHTVSWFDIVKWCNARSEREGLEPVYSVAGVVMKSGTLVPTADWDANGYRLPTEAEWEKAARGGVAGKRYPWGADTISHNQANYFSTGSSFGNLSGNAGYHPSYTAGATPYTSPVGSFAANGYGLYDMAGNVFEWCWDWYGTTAYVNGATDPRGPATAATRVFRGGGWFIGANRCRASDRHFTFPTDLNNGTGFRVARSSGL
jgi:formylglycine-generating enzyme